MLMDGAGGGGGLKPRDQASPWSPEGVQMTETAEENICFKETLCRLW